MYRKFFGPLAALFALSGAQMLCAQTAATQPWRAFVRANARAARPASLTPVTGITGPGIIPIGSALTFGGTDSPDTYSATTTFSSTPVLVDNGAVKIWQSQVPTGPTGEWDVFYMETTNGGPLANDTSAEWSIVMNYTLSTAAVFDAVANQWLVNGTPVSPLTNGIGSICCAAASNPILPGYSYYNSGFSGQLSAGVQTNWQQIFVRPYTLVTNGGINPSTANAFTFALHFSLAPSIVDVVSASAFGEFPTFAPGSWIEIYGTNLAPTAQTWGASDFNGVDGPTMLGENGTTVGTSVTVGGQPAVVDYISPLQVNVQVPGTVTPGSQDVVVTNALGSSPAFSATVLALMPGLLAPSNFMINGLQNVVALFPDNTYVLPPGAIAGVPSNRAKPGDTIVLYGIGFGPVNPDIPPGQLVGENNTLESAFTISFGGVPAAQVAYDGLVQDYMGLYQFNVIVPNVPASDTTPLTFTLNGVSGTQNLVIAIGN